MLHSWPSDSSTIVTLVMLQTQQNRAVVRDMSRSTLGFTSTHADLRCRSQGYIRYRPVSVQVIWTPSYILYKPGPHEMFSLNQYLAPKLALLSAPVQGMDWNVSSRQATAACGV